MPSKRKARQEYIRKELYYRRLMRRWYSTVRDDRLKRQGRSIVRVTIYYCDENGNRIEGT